jgi:hypothetical protein
MGKDEDDPDDSNNGSDYNSIDAERDAQEDDDDEGKPHPKTKVPPPTTSLTSFEAISIRVGLMAKKCSTETQDTTDKSTQVFRARPLLPEFPCRKFRTYA